MGVPVIRGFFPVMVPALTAEVWSLVAEAGSSPGFEPVTTTAIRLPTVLAGTVRVRAVAPGMLWPSAVHWYAKVAPLGCQVPSPAVSVLPTRAVPEIVGFGTSVNVDACTDAVAGLVATALS